MAARETLSYGEARFLRPQGIAASNRTQAFRCSLLQPLLLVVAVVRSGDLFKPVY
jgi:hypothetical protein